MLLTPLVALVTRFGFAKANCGKNKKKIMISLWSSDKRCTYANRNKEMKDVDVNR